MIENNIIQINTKVSDENFEELQYDKQILEKKYKILEKRYSNLRDDYNSLDFSYNLLEQTHNANQKSTENYVNEVEK